MSLDPLNLYSRTEIAAGAAHFRHVQLGTVPSRKEAKRTTREDEAESRERIGAELDATIADTRTALARAVGQRGAEDNLATRHAVQIVNLPVQRRAMGRVL